MYALEDEIQALKDGQQKQARDFERKALEHEANVKRSFLQDIHLEVNFPSLYVMK